MHMIQVLASGVAGAENGFVDLVVRGTSTPATYYTDFEGTSSATGTNVTLDQYGGKVMFVNQLVTVTVKSAGGSTVRQFTCGDSAPAVEVRSASFNGAAYSGGAIAAGNPTTLQAVLDKWYVSAGATDFMVDSGGTATPLSSIAAALARYYVVTDPAYGATGDGVTNDLAAVQAAINAANSDGGGIVFFPRGTYLLNGTLTTYQTVELVGIARDLAVLKIASASTSLVSGTAPLSVKSLKFTFSASTYSGNLFNVTATGSMTLSDVYIPTAAISGSLVTSSAAISLTVDKSVVYLRAAGAIAALTTTSAFTMRDSDVGAFSAEVLSGTFASAGVITLRSNVVSVSDLGAGGAKVVFAATAAAGALRSVDMQFAGSTIASVTLFSTSTGTIEESMTTVTTGVSSGLFNLYALSGSYLRLSNLESRRSFYSIVNGNLDPVTVPLARRTAQVRTSTSAGWTGNCQVNLELAPIGAEMLLSVWNDTAGALTYEWGTGVSVAGGTTFTVAANSARQFALVSRDSPPASSTTKWYLVADVGGAEVVE